MWMDLEMTMLNTKWSKSDIEKEWNNSICSNVDGPGDDHVEY